MEYERYIGVHGESKIASDLKNPNDKNNSNYKLEGNKSNTFKSMFEKALEEKNIDNNIIYENGNVIENISTQTFLELRKSLK